MEPAIVRSEPVNAQMTPEGVSAVKKGLSSGYVAARDVKGNYLGGWWIYLPTERENTYKSRPYQKDFDPPV